MAGKKRTRRTSATFAPYTTRIKKDNIVDLSKGTKVTRSPKHQRHITGKMAGTGSDTDCMTKKHYGSDESAQVGESVSSQSNVNTNRRSRSDEQIGSATEPMSHTGRHMEVSDSLRLRREVDDSKDDLSEDDDMFDKPLKFIRSVEGRMTKEMKTQRKTRIEESQLHGEIGENQWPIVYSNNYNITFYGLQRLHPFDSCKWGRIRDLLSNEGSLQINSGQFVEAQLAEEEDLLVVHTKRYLDSLQNNSTVAHITEILMLGLLPNWFNWLVDQRVLKPLRYQTGGTVLAAQLAMKRGWAINLGGGFHHCCHESGGGFCAYADITLALTFLFEKTLIQKAMIIDLDAHQGNGHERDFMDDDRVYIMDVYNADIYPRDNYAKGAIKKRVQLHSCVGDEEYLKAVKRNLKEAMEEFAADIIIYNAGTDVLEGDALGRMNLTSQGIVTRDEMVFQIAKDMSTPIAMVTSGGYQWRTAEVVATSIINLHDKNLIHGPPKSGERDLSSETSKCSLQ